MIYVMQTQYLLELGLFDVRITQLLQQGVLVFLQCFGVIYFLFVCLGHWSLLCLLLDLGIGQLFLTKLHLCFELQPIF